MLVPNRVTPTIYPLKSLYEVASSVTLSCSVTYPQSDLIDVDTTIILLWSNSSNQVLNFSVGPLTPYVILNYTISTVKLSDAGQYTCQYNVSSNNSFVLTSDVMRAVTNVSVQS